MFRFCLLALSVAGLCACNTSTETEEEELCGGLLSQSFYAGQAYAYNYALNLNGDDVVTAGERVEGSNYVLWLDFESNGDWQSAARQPKAQPQPWWQALAPIAPAYACSPTINFAYYLHSMTITADQEFNGVAAGESLNDKFIVWDFPLSTDTSVTEYVANHPWVGPMLLLQLNEQPAEAGDYSFNVSYQLSDGQSYSVSSDSITLE